MSTSAIVAIVLAIGIMGFLAWAARKEKTTLLKQGLIIERPHTFYKKEEEFTLSVNNPELITQKIKEMPYQQMAVQMNCNSEKQVFVFKGVSFSAQLYRREETENKTVYCFGFTEWTSSNGIPKGLMLMNVLLTSVEKAMVSVDSNAQVQTHEIKIKTKHSFL